MTREKWTSEKLFARLLNNKTQKSFWINIGELRKRVNANVYNQAFKLANSNKEKEKIIGIYVLAQLGFNPRFQQQKTVDLYFKLLEKEESPKVLSVIISSIGHNNENLKEDQILKLIEYSNHSYSDVRFQLAVALSSIEMEHAVRTLIELSTDKHPKVRDWATFGIGSQLEVNSELIIKALWNRIDDSDRGVRFEAIAGLAQRKDKNIKKVLLEELKSIDEYGLILLESIEDLNDKDFIESLEKQIERNKESQRINEKWLIDSLEKLKCTQNNEAVS